VRTEARFPSVEKAAGHYESFYIKACRPGGGLGLWLRHTVHKRPGHDPKGSIWFVLFDAEAEGPLAGKVTVDAAEVSAGEGAYIRIADAVLEDGRASGAIACPTVDASWDLSFEPRSEAYFHLPREWMYKAPLPKTKLLSPYPDALYSGTLRVKPAGGEEREVGLDRWPGMVGHNWGSEHAERWIWMNGAGFEGHEGWFDAALGRMVRLPWAEDTGARILVGYISEITVHTWDLATATGRMPTWDDQVLQAAFSSIRAALPAENRRATFEAVLAGMPPEVRRPTMPFGEAVPVAADAPLLHRLMAWTGRCP